MAVLFTSTHPSERCERLGRLDRWKWGWATRCWTEQLTEASSLELALRKSLGTIREREVLARGYAM